MQPIKITKKAINYFGELIKKEKNKNLNIYLSIIYQSTQYAHVNIIYCTNEDINPRDDKLIFETFILYIDHKSKKFLNNALIDIKNNRLSINAPNIKLYNKPQSTIKNQIKQLIANEINVILSQHGGFIELINIINNDTITIKFHGGCQGCGMVGQTLNNYIEKLIKKTFPQIKTIKDITSHELNNNPFY